MGFTRDKAGDISNLAYTGFVSSLGDDDKIIEGATGYSFFSGVVVDVLCNPKEMFEQKIDENEESLTVKQYYKTSIENYQQIELTPKNSIVAYILDDLESKIKGKSYLCYPFFSNHFSLPVKPGEHVWILGEANRGKTVYYWMTRKSCPYQIEDPNYSILERYMKDSKLYNLSKKVQHKDVTNRLYHFHENKISPLYPNDAQLLDIVDDAYANKNDFTSEPVPSIYKKPGDTLIQGSNNSYIHFTTEKFTDREKCNTLYNESFFVNGNNRLLGKDGNEKNRIPFSPAIDISIASFKKDILELHEQATTDGFSKDVYENDNLSIAKNTRGTYEINKSIDNIENAQRDSASLMNQYTALNCGSRLYMSNNCTIDDVFDINISDFENQHGSSIVSYSENNRLFATNTLLIANNFNKEETSYLSINKEGIIQLGSKNANKESEGGTTGLQPFVRGDDLETVLKSLIMELNTVLNTIGTAMQTSLSPFFSIPIPSLTSNASSVLSSASSINNLTQELPKFKSTLIKGE